MLNDAQLQVAATLTAAWGALQGNDDTDYSDFDAVWRVFKAYQDKLLDEIEGVK